MTESTRDADARRFHADVARLRRNTLALTRFYCVGRRLEARA